MKINKVIILTIMLLLANIITIYKYYDLKETNIALTRGNLSYLKTLIWTDSQLSQCYQARSNQ